MRWVLGIFLLFLFVAIASNVSVAYGEVTCDYTPSCEEYAAQGTLGCSTCEARKYNTACEGGCNYSSTSTMCFSYGTCDYPDTQTTSDGCSPGYIKNIECSSSTCDWVSTSGCYLDPSGDWDGDGVSNTADDCDYDPGGPDSCNGCPNPVCSGCLTWPSACPSTGPRLCTQPDNAQCTTYSCPTNGCIGDNYCTYTGSPYCDANTASCTCPAASCVYSAACDLDDDNDGIADPNDQCPSTAAGAKVDPNGCSCAQKTCSDGNVCTSDSCGATSAECIYAPLAVNTACVNGSYSGTCNGAGYCAPLTTCSAVPGCRSSLPLGAALTTGSCPSEQQCYTCGSATWCSDRCVSLSVDPLNCGACGHACTSSQTCSDGACVTATTSYRDADGDTYGNPLLPGSGTGYVGNSLDCNDANPAIKPGATEVCNGVDDDCDGTVDAADASMVACPAGQSCTGGQCVATPTPVVSLSLTPSSTAVSVAQSFSLAASLSGVSAVAPMTIDGSAVTCSFSGSTCSASVSRSKSVPGSYSFTAASSGKTASTSVTVSCPSPTTWDSSKGQCVAPCAAVCPDASAVACGVAITPSESCGSCEGTGSLCDADEDGEQDIGFVCQAGAEGSSCVSTDSFISVPSLGRV